MFSPENTGSLVQNSREGKGVVMVLSEPLKREKRYSALEEERGSAWWLPSYLPAHTLQEHTLLEHWRLPGGP